nr:hypothetical protein [Bacilli bacterium]
MKKSIMALSTIAMLASMAAPAFAAQTVVHEDGFTLTKSSIVETNKTAYTAYTFAAKDPNSGVMTTFVPIYPLMQVLKAANVRNTWNGTTWHLLTNFSGPINIHGKHGKDEITIEKGMYYRTGVIESGVPSFVLRDPSTGVKTTFFGLYYAEQVFVEHGMPASWNGKTHTFRVVMPGKGFLVIPGGDMQKVKPGTEVSHPITSQVFQKPNYSL